MFLLGLLLGLLAGASFGVFLSAILFAKLDAVHRIETTVPHWLPVASLSRPSLSDPHQKHGNN